MAKSKDKNNQPVTLTRGEIWQLIHATYISSLPYLLAIIGTLALTTFLITTFPSLLGFLFSAIIVVGLWWGWTRVLHRINHQHDNDSSTLDE